MTELGRWRIKLGAGGSHAWDYLSEEESLRRPQNEIDRYWLGIPLNLPSLTPPKNALDSARNGYHFLKHLQAPDGHFPGEYGGPMFILPGLVIASYIVEAPFMEPERLEMIRYLQNTAHPVDGGWGLHVGGPSTMLGTALNYVSLRLLGVDAQQPTAVKARKTLHELGGAAACPTWGKVWLCLLGCYEWEGVNPMPPELWLLPDWLPFHPSRWWVQNRSVFLPMTYLYRVRFKATLTPLTSALRKELYMEPYNSIFWPAQRDNIAPGDLHAPRTLLLRFMNLCLSATVETFTIRPLQRRALDRVYQLICMEDENTNFQDIAPVSKMLHLVCRFHAEGRESTAVAQHIASRGDVMWVTPDGMLASGTNGSQLWDTAFIAQALAETGLINEEENQESALKMLNWLDEAQIRHNPKHFKTAYRHPTKGAWSFSTKEQGYTLTDCTGEGLKAVLYMQNSWRDAPKLVSDARLFDAVDLMLGMQNSDGGFASYELIRAPQVLESLNATEVFGNTMTEHTYVECTTSVITALRIFQKHHPEYRKKDIDRTTALAIQYLHTQQRPDGSWYGSWGICFTYAMMFALESLALGGETYANSASVKRACEFLISKQMTDGGWGESYRSCIERTYIHHEQSQVVQTSWAALALIYARYPDVEPLKRAVALVRARQLPASTSYVAASNLNRRQDGSWAQEAVEGIFNTTCTINYPLFKLTFTVWMLGLAHKYIEGGNSV
ncbi:Terpene cyclase/mutase family member [Mycena indigotica]|uniref:Terpene cyclase/mutase family member n=1 Tax=Mycena indigotica TaxID=2126181 RepID=A0A8H6WG57_9AGAR|nr:Terpene cyclase/mutase family member [Mycena indigotica]KAF7315481.1 Terpene cyclase/mutase family member [Mycena indigotica]